MTAVTLPNSSLQAGFIPGEDDWSDEMNRNLRVIDAVMNIVALSRNESEPPAAVGGDVYIVGPAPAGDWAGFSAGDIAIYMEGDDVVSTWTNVTPRPGWVAYLVNEDRVVVMSASDGWNLANGVQIYDDAGAGAITATDDHVGKYTRFTDAGTKSLIMDDSVDYDIGARIQGRNVGAGLLTFGVAGVFVLNFQPGSQREVSQGSRFEIIVVATGEADVTIYPGNGLHVVTDATTAASADASNSGRYTRFTHASAKTYSFDSADDFEIGAVYRGRVVGAASLTLTEVGTFNINPPAGGSLVIPTNTSFTVVIVGPTEADLILA